MTETTKTRRITKKDYYAAIVKAAEANSLDFSTVDPDITNDMVKTFAQNELDLLAKKNAADRKPSKGQVENDGIKTKILAVLDTTPATVSDIMKRDDDLAALSNQKVSVLVNQLCANGIVVKTTDKRKSLFALA